MNTLRIDAASQPIDREWVSFPGDELQGPRPTVLCAACRAKPEEKPTNPSNLTNRPLCFACYRATLERERALKAAGEFNTASEARFQSALPLEPVNRLRLARLRSERAAERIVSQAGVGRHVDKRRHAQIAARHALQRIVVGLRERNASAAEHDRALSSAAHAAELQLPDAWLPFVVSR